MRRLHTAFRRDEGWDQFHRATSILGASAAWTANNDAQLRLQTSVRHLLPAHRSTAGTEARTPAPQPLRATVLLAAQREPHQPDALPDATHLNNRDDVNAYHRILRRAAEPGEQTAPRSAVGRTGRPSSGSTETPVTPPETAALTSLNDWSAPPVRHAKRRTGPARR